ncbi:hypothetical protein L218DRAFT_989781 [Marasmius fiardii PR-910]|nr:hypothetical protein L218DRAFT_989781 [Marasmius fiardii PR-910]
MDHSYRQRPHRLCTSSIHLQRSTNAGSPSSFIVSSVIEQRSPLVYRDEAFSSSSKSPATPSTVTNGPVTPSPVSLPSSLIPPKNGQRESNLSLNGEAQWFDHSGHLHSRNAVLASDYSHHCVACAYEYPGAAAASSMFHEVPPLPPQDWGQTIPAEVTCATDDFLYHQIPQSPTDGWHSPVTFPFPYSHFYAGTSSQHPLVENAPLQLYPETYTSGSGNDGGWVLPEPTVGGSNGVQTVPYDQLPVYPPHPQVHTRPTKRSTKKRSSTPRCIYQDTSDPVGRRSDFRQSSSASFPIGEGAEPLIVRRVVGNDSGDRASLARRKKEAKHFCPLCKKDFTEKHGLDNHLNAHYGRKPFACGGCRKEFTTRHTRDRHVKTCPSFQSQSQSQYTFVNLMKPSVAH